MNAQKAQHDGSSPVPQVVMPDGELPVGLASGVIESKLGEGGVAIVYEIWVEKLGIHRAVKLLKPNHSRDTLDRFENEMRITAQLRHPNIIEIHSVGEWHGLPYMEMEKVEGFSLETLLSKRGGLPVEVATAIAIMIARALHFTHTHEIAGHGQHHRGILHRDLKPANILISNAGGVKLTDFGIARPNDASDHTKDGMVVGSMQYLAPEQLDEKPVDARSDVFSFGCVLYEMLTGHKTFADVKMSRLVNARMDNAFTPMHRFKVRMPRKLRQLVEQCLEYEPERRVAEAGMLLKELEKIHRTLTPLTPEETLELFARQSDSPQITVYHRRTTMRLVKAAIPVVVLLLALAGTGVWLYTDSLGLSGADATDAAGEEKTQESQARDQRREVAVSSSAEPENGPRVSTRTPSAQRETPTRRPRRRKEPSTPRSARKKAPPPAPSAGAASGESGPPEATKPRQDLLPLMVQSVQDGQYEKALDIYSRLESHQALSRRGLIYRLRALASLNDQQRLQAFFEGHSIPDGEYYLRKCEYLTGKGAWAKAIEAARAASHTPSEYLSEDHIERQSIYYIALCRTGIHAVKATEESRKAALDSWFNVKFAYRNRQEHLHFAEANRHIRHLIQDGKSSE